MFRDPYDVNLAVIAQQMQLKQNRVSLGTRAGDLGWTIRVWDINQAAFYTLDHPFEFRLDEINEATDFIEALHNRLVVIDRLRS